MAHRILDGHTDAYVDGLCAGKLWLREGRSPVSLVAVDAESGAERGRVVLPDDRFFGPRFFSGKGTVAVMVSSRVWLLDADTLAIRRRLDEKIFHVSPDGTRAFLTSSTPHAITAIALPSLETTAHLEIGGYSTRYDFIGTAVEDVLLYCDSESVLCLDAVTLAERWRFPLAATAWEWSVATVAGRAFALAPRETRVGPMTVVFGIDLATGARTELFAFAGSKRAHSNGGDFLLVQVELPDGANEIVAWMPGASAPAFRIPCGEGGWAQCCHVDGALGAVSLRGALDVFAVRGGNLFTVRVPMPEHYTPTAIVSGGRVFASAAGLFEIDVAALPFATEHRAVDIAFEGKTPLALSASASVVPVSVRAPARNLEVLRESAERFGFTIPPLLAALLEVYDGDDVARRWIQSSGMELRVTGFSNCWIGTDPAFLGFAGDGSGQQWGLYLYPPQMKAGVECAVAYWDHETREVSMLATTFEEFLADQLYRMNEEAADELVMLLEKLGLPPDFAQERVWVPPPAWFSSAHGEARPTLAEVDAALERDPISGERVLVAYVRENEKDDEGIARMELLYERLGWRFHRENLRQLKQYAKR